MALYAPFPGSSAAFGSGPGTVNLTASTLDATYNPFPKVKPDDYIAPRRGPAYQVTVPDWPSNAPSRIQATSIRVEARCLHRADAPLEVVTPILEELEQRRRLVRVLRDGRPAGPGVEVVLACLLGCGYKTEVAKAALAAAMRFAESRSAAAAEASWEIVKSQAGEGLSFSDLTSQSFFGASSAASPGETGFAGSDIGLLENQVSNQVGPSASLLGHRCEWDPSESISSAFVDSVEHACRLFASIVLSDDTVAQAAPMFPSSQRLGRTREWPWMEDEVVRFAQGIDRHGRAFSLVARTVGSRSPQQCVSYYYGLWRKTPHCAEFNRRRNRSDRQKRVERELLRRDRAWFHMWRFDEDAIGPPMPPAAVQLPDVLQLTLPPTVGYLEDGSWSQSITPSGGEPAVQVSGRKRKLNEIQKALSSSTQSDVYQFPVLVPNVEVIVDAAGAAFDAPPQQKSGTLQQFNATGPAVTTRSAAARLAALTAPTSTPMQVMEFPLGGNITFGPSVDASKSPASAIAQTATQRVSSLQSGRSDVALLAATLQKERIDQERKLLRERLLKDLSGAQHVDPLSDYHRLMEAAESALSKADPQKCVLNTSHVHLPATSNSSSSHCTSPLAALEQAAIVAHSASHLPHIFSDSWIDERFIENESFCGLCGDGGDLICCEGPCRRSFHRDCLEKHDAGLKASLKASPALQSSKHMAGLFDYERDDWRCSACVIGVHDCLVCGKPGHDGVDVFRCARLCGKYYHMECVQNNPRTKFLAPIAANGNGCKDLNVAFRADELAKDDIKLQGYPPGTSPRFVCPFHSCAECNTPFHPFHPPLYYRCHACPVAYHISCVPKDAFIDMVDIVTCPNKAGHESKVMSSLYKGKSGLMRAGQMPSSQPTATADSAALELMRRNALGRARIGDAPERKVANVAAPAPPPVTSEMPRSSPVPPSTSVQSSFHAHDGDRESTRQVDSIPLPDGGRRLLPTINAVSRAHRGVSAATALRTHFELLDDMYYMEMRKRAQAIASSNDLRISDDYRGVKKVVNGRVTKFLSRIFHNNTLRHLGTFENALDAAVAFDYATTYLRGRAAPRLNFPGSESDCRATPPIDPWPIYVVMDPVKAQDLPEPRLSPADAARWPPGALPFPFGERPIETLESMQRGKLLQPPSPLAHHAAVDILADEDVDELPDATYVSNALQELPGDQPASVAAAASMAAATSLVMGMGAVPNGSLPLAIPEDESDLRMLARDSVPRVDPRLAAELPAAMTVDPLPTRVGPVVDEASQDGDPLSASGGKRLRSRTVNVNVYSADIPDHTAVYNALNKQDVFPCKGDSCSSPKRGVWELSDATCANSHGGLPFKRMSPTSNISETATSVTTEKLLALALPEFPEPADRAEGEQGGYSIRAPLSAPSFSGQDAFALALAPPDGSRFALHYDPLHSESAERDRPVICTSARPELSLPRGPTPSQMGTESGSERSSTDDEAQLAEDSSKHDSSRKRTTPTGRKSGGRKRRAQVGERPKSTFIGVAVSSWNAAGPTRWSARISENNKVRHIGTYTTEEDAAAAYDLEAYRMRGPRAIMNFEMSGSGPDTSKRINMIVKGPGGGIIVRANGHAISVGALAHERQHEYSPFGSTPRAVESTGDRSVAVGFLPTSKPPSKRKSVRKSARQPPSWDSDALTSGFGGEEDYADGQGGATFSSMLDELDLPKHEVDAAMTLSSVLSSKLLASSAGDTVKRSSCDLYGTSDLDVLNSSPTSVLPGSEGEELKGVQYMSAPSKHSVRFFAVKVFIKTERRQVQVNSVPSAVDAALEADRWLYALQGPRAALNFPHVPPKPLSEGETAGFVLPTECPFVHVAYQAGGSLCSTLGYLPAEPLDARKGSRTVAVKPLSSAEAAVDRLWETLPNTAQIAVHRLAACVFGLSLPLTQMLRNAQCAHSTPSRAAAVDALVELAASQRVDIEKAREVGGCVTILDAQENARFEIDPVTWQVSLPVRVNSDVVVDALCGAQRVLPVDVERYPAGYKSRIAFSSHVNAAQREIYHFETFTGVHNEIVHQITSTEAPVLAFRNAELGKLLLMMLEVVFGARIKGASNTVPEKRKSKKADRPASPLFGRSIAPVPLPNNAGMMAFHGMLQSGNPVYMSAYDMNPAALHFSQAPYIPDHTPDLAGVAPLSFAPRPLQMLAPHATQPPGWHAVTRSHELDDHGRPSEGAL